MRHRLSPQRTVWVILPPPVPPPCAILRASVEERTPGMTFNRSPICRILLTRIPLAAAMLLASRPGVPHRGSSQVGFLLSASGPYSPDLAEDLRVIVRDLLGESTTVRVSIVTDAAPGRE